MNDKEHKAFWGTTEAIKKIDVIRIKLGYPTQTAFTEILSGKTLLEWKKFLKK